MSDDPFASLAAMSPPPPQPADSASAELMKFFAGLGLKKAEAYSSCCLENDVTAEMICGGEVTSEDLKELGFTVGDRAKIRAHLAASNEGGSSRASGDASAATASVPSPKTAAVPLALPRLVVPQKVISAGFDYKFLHDPADIDLQSLLTREEYTEAVLEVNATIRPARANSIDWALLGIGAGTLLVPFGIRNYRRKKYHKKLLLHAIENFNEEHPKLAMRWRSKPNSELVIERHPAHLEDAAI